VIANREGFAMAANNTCVPPTVPPAARPGTGTLLYGGGVAFRVWAPFACNVFAAGTFNEWSATANPFASEGMAIGQSTCRGPWSAMNINS
jgi:hypothetical protein